jgi:mRNA-degrading endonuclease HigB of HigAB toxin-antitoxin module
LLHNENQNKSLAAFDEWKYAAKFNFVFEHVQRQKKESTDTVNVQDNEWTLNIGSKIFMYVLKISYRKQNIYYKHIK